MNFTITTPFLFQKTVAISFLAGRRLFKLFWASGERVCIHCSYNETEKYTAIVVASL
jgi:hypothetical protein